MDVGIAGHITASIVDQTIASLQIHGVIDGGMLHPDRKQE